MKRRLAHLLFTLCAALSLLLCLAVCVLWVRGLGGFDSARWAYIHGATQTRADDKLRTSVPEQGDSS